MKGSSHNASHHNHVESSRVKDSTSCEQNDYLTFGDQITQQTEGKAESDRRFDQPLQRERFFSADFAQDKKFDEKDTHSYSFGSVK